MTQNVETAKNAEGKKREREREREREEEEEEMEMQAHRSSRVRPGRVRPRSQRATQVSLIATLVSVFFFFFFSSLMNTYCCCRCGFLCFVFRCKLSLRDSSPKNSI